MKIKVIYIGLFLEQQIKGTLEKQITKQHITTCFDPSDEQINEVIDLLGQKYTFSINGYGIDDNNEGLLVPKVKELPYYHGSINPHITISVSNSGKPVNTWKIEFGELINTMPSEVTCRLGVYTNSGKVLYEIKKDEL